MSSIVHSPFRTARDKMGLHKSNNQLIVVKMNSAPLILEFGQVRISKLTSNIVCINFTLQ